MPAGANHDYKLNFGDKILARIRKAIPSPELRHQALFPLAYMAPILGHKAKLDQKLSYQINFKDGSAPLYLSNPFILAAGANKTGRGIVPMANLGFGGVTVGTATRYFRKGNANRPRMGMVEADRCIHNSMGLNNPGVEVISQRVKQSLGAAHSKNLSVGFSMAETPGLVDEAERLKELVQSFEMAYQVADYVEINVSCPNTGVARGDLDTQFTEKIFAEVQKIRAQHSRSKAVFAKLSPDLNEAHLRCLLDVVQNYGLSGVVLSNTYPTLQAQKLLQTPVASLPVLAADGAKGGLSGRALYDSTYKSVSFVKKHYPDLAIVASGGVDHGAKAWDLLNAGADAVQCYSVLAYRWFAITQMRKELALKMQENHCSSLKELISNRA